MKTKTLLAFPNDPCTYDEGRGMTLHDYFMAHAPAEPQKWFNPRVPPCPIVPSVRSLPVGELRSELLESDDKDAVSQEAKDWLLERDLLAAQQSDWQKEFRKQLYVQWPAAWADAMLEQRKC